MFKQKIGYLLSSEINVDFGALRFTLNDSFVVCTRVCSMSNYCGDKIIIANSHYRTRSECCR